MSTRRFAASAMAAAALMGLAGAAEAQGAGRQDQRDRPAGNVPPADQPLIRRIPEPTIAVEGGFGMLGYLGGTAGVGPTWNVRVTGSMSPRVAVEANYIGSVNQRPTMGRSLVLTSLDAGLRYNVLRADEAIVQPFVVAGLGYAGWAGEGGDAFALTVPVTVGVERLVTRNVKLGARFNFRPAFFDDLTVRGAASQTGGDSWALLAHGGGAF
ncbi:MULTISPECIES: hypothetical protein [Sorangium]|uniref:Outer membrane protein beta-barrel domain-containing protein n=1 Tax=Sorangium cellulosum TaxID=56 RepID=A0A4P2QXZ2_SORCE|nr:MULTISPECIES: hypothetical protein [Sorangium]AUX35434.1 hypothetical protein SOCE836_076260 [Sorangium cellulosum]WCQ94738.1 hypothetical protein NQZ70_07507 [Sorangium sp. Soce836]